MELRHRRRAIAAYRLAAWHRQEPVKSKVLTHSGDLSLTHTRASAPPCGSEARFLLLAVVPRWLRWLRPSSAALGIAGVNSALLSQARTFAL